MGPINLTTKLMKVGFAFTVALTLAAPTVVGTAHGAQQTEEKKSFFARLFKPSESRKRERAKQRNKVKPRRYTSNKSPIRKRRVRFDKQYDPGTVVIDTSERRLYYVLRRGRALKYGVGVGRTGFQWSGTHRISRKAEWPGWTPPKRMIARVKRETGKTLKAYYPGGPSNPLGARALYLGSSIYRIHGTNQPWSIGKAMSSGCIRMANDDVADLYKRIGVGTKVVVRH